MPLGKQKIPETNPIGKSPVVFYDDNKNAKKISNIRIKDPEERTYIILSVLLLDDKNEGMFQICHGRTECYETIGYLLDKYDDYDIDRSVVLVESLQVNRKTDKEEYFLCNYENAASVYSFCKQVEGFYEDNKSVRLIDIESYKSDIERDNSENLKANIYINQEALDLWNELNNSSDNDIL